MNDELPAIAVDKDTEKIKIKCIGNSAKEKLTDILSDDSDMKKILKSVAKAPICGDVTPKRKTERSNFLGQCMRGTDKGGMGKKMGECSTMFKGMSPEEKSKYKVE